VATRPKVSSSKPSSSETGINGFPDCKAGAPPSDKASSGRANPEGISYLYLSSDKETACAELRATLDDILSVSAFKPKKELKILNLHKAELANKEEMDAFYFIKNMMSSFMRPIRKQGDSEYCATQYVASYIQANTDLDGIKWISSFNHQKDAFNVVLFDVSAAECADKYGEVFKPLKTETTFQNISLSDSTPLKASTFDCNPLTPDEVGKIRHNLHMSQKHLK